MDHLHPGARSRFSARLSSRSASSKLASGLQRKSCARGLGSCGRGQMIWLMNLNLVNEFGLQFRMILKSILKDN